MKIDSFYKLGMRVSKIKCHALDMLVWYASRGILNLFLPLYFNHSSIKNGKPASTYVQNEVIVSLTTFPQRINTVYIVLETLFRQSVKPDRIILWLADEQFPEKSAVRDLLKKYIDLGLEIRFCEDLRSHKKYYYSMMDNPNSIVVTCDDDILYSEYMLERLLQTSNRYPNTIICERAHEMTFCNGELCNYIDWNYRARGVRGPSMWLCPTGAGGCLYPPHSLSQHVFDKKQIMELCFLADDMWLKCMSYLANTMVVLTRVDSPEILDVIGTKKTGLAQINVEGNQNDKQLLQVTNYYSINWSKHNEKN